MKLLNATFENFRLLRDLKIDFTCSTKRNLIVIRGANESGKTTILTALQWALFGDEALPNRGADFRLQPLDWDQETEGINIGISVIVEFEILMHIPGRQGSSRTETRTYRIIRTCREEYGDKSTRAQSTAKLYQVSDRGDTEIENPEPIIENFLPKNLREVFFTDGDRALTFVEAVKNTKRERVKGAVRQLLGLEVIEKAQKHLERTHRDVNKRIQSSSKDSELKAVTKRIELIFSEKEELEKELNDAREQKSNLDEAIDRLEKDIEDALVKGDREELAKELNTLKRQITDTNKKVIQIEKDHSNLFKEQSLADELLAPAVRPAIEKLKEMHKKGDIPKQTIPVLEESLKSDICICGESLSIDNPDGNRRREHVQSLINNSREADDIKQILTQLHYQFSSVYTEDLIKQWSSKYDEVMVVREQLDKLQNEQGRQEKTLQSKLEKVGSTDVQGLRSVLREHKSKRDSKIQKEQECSTKLEALKSEEINLERQRTKLIDKEGRAQQSQAELDVVQDIRSVFENAFSRIMNDELSIVSDRMNELFLEMIVADPEQGSIIKQAEIDKAFDILVYGGRQNRLLNPDTDLNGAARRALSMAFVLALTKVSGVDAPNVIDTPLGMTAGLVRRSMLRTAIDKSSQLILFLTHDEIKGCEDIIEDTASRVMTITNTAHYPRLLEHEPASNTVETVLCTCSYNQECPICERRKEISNLETSQEAGYG